ncbi:uncharacterized protein LOC132728898 [Ruditapes philippinarum]|uniref:uncharacterized protein LOC132728898 n=1 Tax=Ruditapes philippinarum TaxID=129788 RepID=UPI00295B42ED|nr:uncharacterized protein LOC132728898 [Ruditapes philippinarum]XP_060570588.1 uncharacterized protein LOC132728898 [Ruditapes philippinarum]XP_060570589.1 uncharacterized protein LOC132728898 [Ruditapes philippinarum]XP_060570590.1 uncharacterized protein LOC132728898 [Ruditapes philippinarum]XP_060570591.1 uncharacterized protein LOC132728898 [Ruditapes philippinarum]
MSTNVLLPNSRRTMKKENNNSDKTSSSRPSSAGSVSSKTSSSHKSKEHKQKDKGPSKEELIKANAELCREVESLNEENQLLKSTITSVIDKLIENAKIKGIKIPREIENPDVTEIPSECLVALTEKMTAESHKSNTMEYRVEELETRITHLNTELAKLLRTRVNVENGLDEILNDCDNVDEIKVKARELIRDIKGNSLFTFLDSLPYEQIHLSVETSPRLSLSSPAPENQSTPRISKPKPKPVVLTNENLDLRPPLKKLDGNTQIKEMHKDLRLYVEQQLSLPKGNGADWRMMGDRLGIPQETINQWKRWKLEQPMHYVLQAWSSSPGATVRLLHRHLVSPQMRCTLLAKRISDFYQVD